MNDSYLKLESDDAALLQDLLQAETKGFVRAVIDRHASASTRTRDIMALVSGHSQYEALIDESRDGVPLDAAQLDFLHCLLEYADPRLLPKEVRAHLKISRARLLTQLSSVRVTAHAGQLSGGWSTSVAQA